MISPLLPNLAVFLALCLCALAGCGDSHHPALHSEVPVVVPTVIRTIPHDTLAFTQGLLLKDGKLYESTGAPAGQVSSVREIDPSDGRVKRILPLPDVFGEGLAVMGNTMVQLTWRAGAALLYTFPALKPEGMFHYSGEGWGLTTDGSAFVMSNGSDTLYARDRLFAVTRRLAVVYQGNPLRRLNELEYARRSVYANVWYSDYIFRIDPHSGRVTQVIDCSSLSEKASGGIDDNVLNGIAYDSSTDRFFLTGKNWSLLFEVEIPS
jgi:glutamine cyclotransferase